MNIIMKLRLLIAATLVANLVACKSGIDFESMNINPEHIIDYGLRAKENKLSVGAKAYAAIKTGSSSAGSYAFSADLVAIERSLKVIVDLPYDHVFGAAGNSAVTAFKTYIDGIVLSIRSKAEAAATNQNGAIDLLNELGNKSLSPAFAANLSSQIQELAKNVPQEAKEIADANSKIIEDSVKRIYQQAAVLSQSLVQKEARAKVDLILKALDGLLKKAENDPTIIGGRADRDLAISEVYKASNRFKNVQNEIGKITTLSKVKPNLVDYVSGNLADLKRDYVDKAPSVKDLYDETEKARVELDTLLGLWREDIKNGPHAGLENTVRTAFGNVSLLSEAVDVNDETDLMRLMRLLVNKSVVVTSIDDNFIEALGGAVAMNIAQELGLPVSNVYALNPASFNDTKSTFGMDDDAFGLYVSSQAEKIYQFTAQDGEYGNIFVLFVDRMAPGLKSPDVINKLKQGKSKVVLLTANPSQYDDAANFAPQGLDLAAAYHVAKAVVSDADPKLNANYIAQIQAKIMYAFKKSPRQMNLNAVIVAAKDAVARLRDRPSLSETEYNQAIKDALASLADNSYDVSLVEQSKLLSTDMSIIVSNIRANQDYYINQGRGIGQLAADEAARRLAEESRSDKRLRREQGLNDLAAISNHSKTTIRKLNEAIVDVGFKDEIDDALLKFKSSKLKIDQRLKVIENLLEDPLCKPDRSFIKNKVGVKIITGGTPADQAEWAKFTNLDQYLTKVSNFAGGLKAELNDTEKPYVAVNCVVDGGDKVKIERKTNTLKLSLDRGRSFLKQVRLTVDSGGDVRQVAMVFSSLMNLASLSDTLKVKIKDFNLTELDNNFWSGPAPVNSLSAKALADSEYKKLNRRMYALLFSTIVGRIQDASVPFTGAAHPTPGTELYAGFSDADAFLPKMITSIKPIDLSENLARSLLIKEVANLMEVYQRFIDKVYSLPIEDREAFEKNATANDFLTFYNKIKALVERADYLDDFKNTAKFQHELRNRIATEVLPDEVMTMLDRYPATHPYIFYRAAKDYFIAKWQSEAGLNPAPPPVAGLISNVYSPVILSFENVDADLESAITGYHYAAMKKKALHPLIDIENSNGDHIAWPRAVGGLSFASYNAIAVPAALKFTRFTSPAPVLNAQSAGVQRLTPILADLVRIAGDIQKSAKKLYFYLSLVKKF